MIILTKNATTIFVATLWEKTTLTNPYYLFEFVNDSTKYGYYTVISNTSTNVPRYNKFSFIEGVNDAENGKLILGDGGYYSYKVYEQLSATNLDPSGLAVVETGKMKLIDTTEEPNFNQHIVSPSTNIVYNPS